MAISSNKRLFFLVCGALMLINVLVLNDFITIWDGAESAFLFSAHFNAGEAALTPAHLLIGWMGIEPVQEFWVRLPGLMFFLLTLVLIYWLLNPVLGPRASIWTILVAGSSFMLPNLAKVATLDIWTFGWHAIGVVLLLRFLKQPRLHWRVFFYCALVLGIWTSPLSTLVLFTVLPLILYWRHPGRKRIWQLQPWLPLFVLAGAMELAGMLDWSGEQQYLAPFSIRFFWLSLLGMFPFLGFLLGGLWEMVAKFRRGEELALLNVALLSGGLLGQSPVLQLVLALLVAKQFHVFFQPNYPYRALVRAGAVVHLVLVFLLAMILMLGGFFRFEGAGFRSGLAFGAVYWMLSFVSVLGLFSGNRRYIWGATIGSGLLPVLLFWLQVYPLVENKRDVPKRLVEAAAEIREGTELPIFLMPDGSWRERNEVLYLKSAYPDISKTEEAGEQGSGIYIAPAGKTNDISTAQDSIVLSGWTDDFRDEDWTVVKY